MVLGLGGVAARLGSVGASSGIVSRVGSALRTPLGAGAAGFGLGEVTDVIGIDLAGSVSGEDGALSGLLGGTTVIWVFAGIALLAAVSNIAGD